MRLLTKDEKEIYHTLMIGIWRFKKVKPTKPPKDFEGW